MITVAIISPFRFQSSVNKAIAGNDFGCSFQTYTYDRLSDIDRICLSCRERCNVILFTGELGYHYMRSRYPDFPIPCEFTVYGVADVLSILLSFHLRHPGIPLQRVYLDFLTPMNHYLHIQDYLPPDQLPFFFEEGTYDYPTITNRAVQLWQEGKIDFVISRSINNLHFWQQHGIPYEAVYPTERMIHQSIEEAVNRERLKGIENSETATFILHLPDTDGITQAEKEYRQATVYKFLVDCRRQYGQDYTIQQGFDRFVCRCAVKREAEDAMNYRQIVLTLRQVLDFPFSLGIGIHANEQTSRYHAELALLESNRHGLCEGFLVNGDPEILMGPLSCTQTVRFAYQDADVTRFARKLGISSANLLRLTGLYRSNPSVILTVSELSPLLGITLRSTRRILQKLYDMNIITPVANSPEGTRGRPIHRYCFLPDALDRELMAEK